MSGDCRLTGLKMVASYQLLHVVCCSVELTCLWNVGCHQVIPIHGLVLQVVVLILCVLVWHPVGESIFFFTTDHMASHLKCNHQVTMYVENHRDQKHSGVIIGASIRLVIVANHLWKMVGNLANMHGKRPMAGSSGL